MKNTSTKRVFIATSCVTPGEALYNLLGRCHGNITATGTTVIAFTIISMRRQRHNHDLSLPSLAHQIHDARIRDSLSMLFCEMCLEREGAIGMA
jgi:hypothetical protein